MAENEVVFREYNEQIKRGFDALKALADEDNQNEHVFENDAPLQFCCECSDESCRKRITLAPSRYNEIHKKRDRFVIVCGHDTKSIERIISEEAEYCIIEKFKQPPKSAPRLNETETNNA